jgi:hypothetical protein
LLEAGARGVAGHCPRCLRIIFCGSIASKYKPMANHCKEGHKNRKVNYRETGFYKAAVFSL